MTAQDRKSLLDEAAGYVTKDRNSVYGEPEDNFGCIANFWNAHLDGRDLDAHPITAVDVALMMAGMKLARLSYNPKSRDQWVDGAGYLACGGEIALRPEPTGQLFWAPMEATKEASAEAVSFPVDQAQDVSKYVRGGWLSDNRCGERIEVTDLSRIGANPHEPHSYGGDSGSAYWCDGYMAAVTLPVNMVHPESDLDVVRRVAEATKPRPIKDAPQA